MAGAKDREVDWCVKSSNSASRNGSRTERELLGKLLKSRSGSGIGISQDPSGPPYKTSNIVVFLLTVDQSRSHSNCWRSVWSHCDSVCVSLADSSFDNIRTPKGPLNESPCSRTPFSTSISSSAKVAPADCFPRPFVVICVILCWSASK